MKKPVALLLMCAMLLSQVGIATASNEHSNVVHTLAGYGIINADEDVDMDQPVTRGEFAGMVARLMCLDTAASALDDTYYQDVPADYKYAGDITALTSIGILNGFSETRFGPKDNVTWEQAVKVLVLITGYGEIALQDGGWSDGYVYWARRNKMLSGVTLSDPFTRASLYKLVYNTLDVPLLNHVITTGDRELEKTDDTLRSQIAGKIKYELYRHTGVIIANSYTYTTAPYSDLYDDEVVIENRSVGESFIYDVGNTNAFGLVGCEVEFYARKTESGYELLSVKPTAENEVIEVTADDFGALSGNTVSYEADGRGERLELDSGYRVVYNGNRVINPDSGIFEIEDGYISFIDNDSDEGFELALIWEYQDAVATSFDGSKLQFLNDARFNSLAALATEQEDDDVKVIVTDKEGNNVESFDTERVVSVFANTTRTRYTIVVSDEIFEGSVQSIGDDGYEINGAVYEAAASLGSVSLDVNYRFYVDYKGKLAFARATAEVNYGYILNYDGKGGLNSTVEAKIILPGKVDAGVETNDEDVTDTSAVPYLILQNGSAEGFTFAKKVRCNGQKYSGNELLSLLGTDGMRAISYELDENGEISEITPLNRCGGNIEKRYQYDVYDRVFGGTAVEPSSGFAINSDTVAVCVPADDNIIDYSASDEDFKVRVNITVANNDIGYRVEGYDYDPITKKARFLVCFATMDADAVTELDGFSSRASVVTSSKYFYNAESGEYDLAVEVLQGSAVKTLASIPLNSDNRAIGLLKKGDLITFSLNKNDLMENAYIMESIPDVSGRRNFEAVSGSVRKSLGTVGKIEYDEVDTYNRALVTRIELYTDEGGYPRTLNVKQKNTPPVYLYNTQDGSCSAVSLKDIIPDYDRVFVYERYGDGVIRAIVIIR